MSSRDSQVLVGQPVRARPPHLLWLLLLLLRLLLLLPNDGLLLPHHGLLLPHHWLLLLLELPLLLWSKLIISLCKRRRVTQNIYQKRTRAITT